MVDEGQAQENHDGVGREGKGQGWADRDETTWISTDKRVNEGRSERETKGERERVWEWERERERGERLTGREGRR